HRNKELVALNSGKRTTVGSGGFCLQEKDYAQKERISRKSFCFGQYASVKVNAQKILKKY
ncbi:hypothetical protein, partial [Enterobacter hormaechei]|uniref:hypothetical protein n=1 Tax=Enterobacter hormaechei TaxID=158836 RepID=UPI00388EC334